MSQYTTYTAPTRADVDKYIAQAHQMRREHLSQLLKAGFSRLRTFFAIKHAPESEAQEYDVWGPVALTTVRDQ